jgi:hypothetical protein
MEFKYFIGRNKWTDSLILNEHYSHRLPTGTCLVVGIRDEKNKVLACCYFSSITAAQWKEKVVELSRLVKLPNVLIQLTQLISYGLKVLKKKGYDLVISYADSNQNHHGGIYQAASWNYHGKREQNLNGFIIDGEFVHRRSLYSKYGTSSSKLKDKLEKKHEVKLLYDEGKHLYWKAINKKGKLKANKLNLQCNPYPKPGTNTKEKITYQETPKRIKSKILKQLF